MAADIVLEAMKGRVRVSENLSSVATWIPKGDEKNYNITIPNPDDAENPTPVNPHLGVPRPDKSGAWLAFLSAFPITGLLGIDHMWLRSPGTGILKLLSNAIVPGLWYLWDILQVFNEWDRVKLYGLNAPFDAFTGIAQGVLYDGWSNQYTQSTNFGVWLFTIFIGFTGIDCLMNGQFWLAFRKFAILLMISAVIIPIIVDPGQSTFLGLLLFFFILPEIIGLLVGWLSDMSYVAFDPAKVIKTGLPTSKIAYESFGYITKMYENKEGELPETDPLYPDLQRLKKTFMFQKGGISQEDMKRMFWIRHGEEQAAPPKKEADVGPAGFPSLTLFLRLFGLLGGWIFFGIKMIWYLIFPAAAVAAAASETTLVGMNAAKRLAENQAKAALAGAGRLPPGAGALGGLPVPGMPQVPGMPPGAGAALNMAGKLNLNEASKGGAAARGEFLNAAGQKGGARDELSTEAQILGATVIALIAGGSLKGLVDYLFVQ